VAVWSLAGRVSGLEIYEHESGSARELPPVESLRPWGPA